MEPMPEQPELTPAACLSRLPEPVLDLDSDVLGEDLRRVELRRSILALAELDHVSEILLVEAVVAAWRAAGDRQ